MKKILPTILLGAGIVTIFYAYNLFVATTNNAGKLERHEVQDALVRTYEDVEELEEASDLIVSVKATGDKVNHTEMDGKFPLYYWTESDFRILEVYKNALSDKIPEIITVNEPYAFINENEILISAGYDITVEDVTYLLFLEKKENEEKYLPIGVYHGKFDMTSNPESYAEKVDDQFEIEHPEFANLRNAVQEKYKIIKK